MMPIRPDHDQAHAGEESHEPVIQGGQGQGFVVGDQATVHQYFYSTPMPPVDGETVLRIRILAEPLTAQNLMTIISALTELSTKYWLIAKKRFADLIEYTQTHNG